jgi:hypothetical protein
MTCFSPHSLIRRSFLGLAAFVALASLSAAAPGSAFALPVLQVYIEGGTYDNTTDTWTLDTAGTGSGGTARVWVIGNVSGEGGKGAISDVNMVISYDAQIGTPGVTLSGSTTGGYGGVTDPSTAADGSHVQTVSDGSSPTFSDGSDLPSHGVFGSGREWQQFALGDFTLSDSAIGDFAVNFPSTLSANAGQINVYDISFSGYNGPFHFDVYGDTGVGTRREKHWAAPFSHDGEATFTQVPEISGGADATSALTLLFGALALVLTPRRRR